jgi:hypothetical protein
MSCSQKTKPKLPAWAYIVLLIIAENRNREAETLDFEMPKKRKKRED